MIYKEFKAVVNMTASALEMFLKSDASQSVGQKKDGATEETGHQEGRRIVEILYKVNSQFSDKGYRHMFKVVDYVNRHLKQGGPKDKGAVQDSP